MHQAKNIEAKKTIMQRNRSTKFAQDLSGHICRVGVRIKGDQVMIAGKHSDAKYLPLTSSCALWLAYAKQIARAVAAAFNCSPPTVATARQAVAACYMALQRHNFDKLVTAFSQVPAPAWRASFQHVKLDETMERAVVRLHGQLRDNQQQKSWHVLVQKRRLICGVLSDQGRSKFVKVDVATPIVPLHNTSANCLYLGLYDSVEGKQSEAFAHEISMASDLSVLVVECDGAFANDKAIWHRFNSTDATIPKCLRLCGNHGLHLIEMLVFHTSNAYKFLSRMYDVARFFSLERRLFADERQR